MVRRFAVAAFVLALTGCVSAPSPDVNLGRLTAEADATPARRLALMTEQSERFAGTLFIPGNRTRLLINGPDSFAALVEAIRSATTRIDMESYEFDETAGPEFADILVAAHSRGVAVNLIYDGWGAKGTPSALFERLRKGGVQVLEFNPLRPNARVEVTLNHRDHRKLLCVDGRVVVTGGVNISRVYENAPGPQTANPNDEAWRDTDIRIEGPAAAEFERFFMATWREQNGPPLAAPPPWSGKPPGATLVQAIDGAPEQHQPVIYRTLLANIALAGRSVHLTTGFFVPPPEMVQALADAARRGVDVQVVVPGRSNSMAALAGGRADYGTLLAAGVQIHEREQRILHAKTVVIDGAWSAVGSSNLDWRSTVWNNEIEAVVLGPAFGEQMEAAFNADIAASRTITLAAWRNRGVGERLEEMLAGTVAGLL